MTAKTGNVYISGTMTNSVEKSNGKSGFSTTASSTEVSLSHCDNVKQRQDWRPKRLYCLSGCRLHSQSPGVAFFEHSVVENSRFAIGISILVVVVPHVKYFRFWRPHYYFRYRCRIKFAWRQVSF